MKSRVVDLIADHAAAGGMPFLLLGPAVGRFSRSTATPIPDNRKPRPIDMLGMSSPCRSPARKCRGPMGGLTC